MKVLLTLFLLIVDVAMAVAIISYSLLGAILGSAAILTFAYFLFDIGVMVARWSQMLEKRLRRAR